MVDDNRDDEQFNDAASTPEPLGLEEGPMSEETPLTGNRPADNARVMSVTDEANDLTNVWAAGDEATDFLGLNTELDEPATEVAQDDSGTRSWLLDHVESSGAFPETPADSPGDSWLMEEGAHGEVLSIAFERLYMLRNQLVHGGATWGSSVNRDQVRDASNLMGHVVPALINIMLCNQPDLSGEPCFPVVT